MTGKLRLISLLIISMLVIIAISACVWLLVASLSKHKMVNTEMEQETVVSSSPSPSPEVTRTTPIVVGGAFTVSIPNGWSARVSTRQDFLAIQVGTPGTIDKLVYSEATPPSVDYSGIPSWNGLTEHFYVRAITKPSQAFDPRAHANVTQNTFMFNDGTAGTLYSVTKDPTEAQKWGGLLKDNEWYGRVFVYETDAVSVEAHLAYYPSTKIDTKMFERIAKSISP